MKKTKLLSSVLVLGLILTLGSCNKKEDDSLSNESVESSEDIVTSLSNYTLSITFIDETNNITYIPEYATAYIIGDFNSWGEFLPLTSSGNTYTYTFTSIEVGVHEFKGVMWYTGEVVSWDNCIEIITSGTGNASFQVEATEGDNYTKELTYSLTLTLEPLSSAWRDYLEENESDNIASYQDITNLLGISLDRILPFFIPEGGYTSITINLLANCVTFFVYGSVSSLTSSWNELLIEFGYLKENSDETRYKYTYNEFRVEIVDESDQGEWNLSLYAPEPNGDNSSWKNHLTSYQLSLIEEFLEVTLDSILPVVLPDEGYYDLDITSSFIRFDVTGKGYNLNSLTSNWVNALTEFGYTKEGSLDYEYSYQGYIVLISLDEAGDFWELDLRKPSKEVIIASKWEDIMSSADITNICAILNKDLDDVLPFYAPDPTDLDKGGYASISVNLSLQCLIINAVTTDIIPSLDSLNETWSSLLIEFGYSESSSTYTYSSVKVVLSIDNDLWSLTLSNA